MNKIKLENFLDDIEINPEVKEFWARIAYKLSPEEIEAFIILKKYNPQDLIKAIDILMRREKALLEKDFQALKKILKKEKDILRDLIFEVKIG
ncbi:hypothetical protein HN615_06685 [Candidatus Woesearchaeota archaeon]|jgi:hypothetical protein|nr:hypothetical protein [Candidatus Woesearchaeota archaeon]